MKTEDGENEVTHVDGSVSTCDPYQYVKAMHFEPGVQLFHHGHLPLVRRTLNLEEYNTVPTVTTLPQC